MRSIFRFSTLALVVSIFGCDHNTKMYLDHPKSLTLAIEKYSTAKAGYITTYGSNGQKYIYRFSGGDGPHGEVRVDKSEGNDVNIKLELSAASTFDMVDGEFVDDNDGQLSFKVDGSGKAHIMDKNDRTKKLDAYYAVKVHDSDTANPGPGDIYCDPRIVNN